MNAPLKWSEDGCQIIDAKGRSVLRIRPSDATEEEFNAIVAAPLLVDECEVLLEYWDVGESVLADSDIADSIRAIVAKVKGK